LRHDALLDLPVEDVVDQIDRLGHRPLLVPEDDLRQAVAVVPRVSMAFGKRPSCRDYPSLPPGHPWPTTARGARTTALADEPGSMARATLAVRTDDAARLHAASAAAWQADYVSSGT